MKKLKRIGTVLSIVLGSYALLFLLWFGAGFFYAPDTTAWVFDSYFPGYLQDQVVLGDNAWHWHPWGLSETTRYDLGFHLPTFERALADTIVADQLYEEALGDYVAPATNQDLEAMQEQILAAFTYFLADWNIIGISAPDNIHFEKYEGAEAYRLGGYYAFDRHYVSINLFFSRNKRWDDSVVNGTVVHELVHAQGKLSYEYYMSLGNEYMAYATLLNHMNETLVQMRMFEVIGLMRRYGVENYEAAYYDELRAFAMRTAYFLMRQDEGAPWTDYPLLANPDVDSGIELYMGWIITDYNERFATAIDEGLVERPATGLECSCHAAKSWIDSWRIAINDWLHAQHTRNWERDFETVFMNLYPSTAERRAIRAMHQTQREQNPWWWSAACWKYWYMPYLNLQRAVGNEAVFQWTWPIPYTYGWYVYLVPYMDDTSMLNAVYYYEPVQEMADEIMDYIGNSFDGSQWILKAMGIEHHYQDEPVVSDEDLLRQIDAERRGEEYEMPF